MVIWRKKNQKELGRFPGSKGSGVEVLRCVLGIPNCLVLLVQRVLGCGE